MSSLLLMTDAVEPSDHVLPALGLLSHQVRVLPAEAAALLDAPARRLDPRRRPPGPTGRPQSVPGAEGHRLGLAGPAHRHRRWSGRRFGRLGRGRHRFGHGGPRRTRRPASGWLWAGSPRPSRTANLRSSTVNCSSTSPVTPPLCAGGTGSHIQGIRTAEIPVPAPRPGLHPTTTAARGVGLRLLRRHPYGRRPRASAAAKLGPEYEALIGTVRNVGYRWCHHAPIWSRSSHRECPDHMAATADRVAGRAGRRHARPSQRRRRVSAISEHSYLHLLAGGGNQERHALAHEDGQIVGYAFLSSGEEPVAEFLVDPGARGRGIGQALLENILSAGGRGSAVGARAAAGSECAGHRGGAAASPVAVPLHAHLAGSAGPWPAEVCRCAHSARRTLRPGWNSTL